jgi:hypothetical protein
VQDWKFHCAVLGVRQDASAKEVRRAYRKLALERHPDKHNNSNKAKEEFQQLNESYRYLMAGLSSGRKPAPTPPPPQPTPWQEQRFHKTVKNSSVPAPVRTGVPSLPTLPFQLPKGYAKIWLHAGAACLVLFVLSIWVDLASLPTTRTSGKDNRDLFLKGWCNIVHTPGIKDPLDLFEFQTREKCEDRCYTMTRNSDVACSWNGAEFQAKKSQLTSPPALPADEASKLAQRLILKAPSDSGQPLCELTATRTGWPNRTVSYNAISKETCLTICNQASRDASSLRCTYEGAEIYRWPFVAKPNEITSPAPIAGSGQSEPIPGDHRMLATCYMTVVTPGNPVAEAIPNETESSCINRCYQEIDRRRADKVVKCAFAGREVVNYIPDPSRDNISRDPAQAESPDSFKASCEIYGELGGRRSLTVSELSTEESCDSRCRTEFQQAPRRTALVCLFNSRRFFMDKVRN